MKLDNQTLQMLRELINVKTEYRSGPMLIEFFQEFGFNDLYGNGFPSRWKYTDEKLNKINGTPNLDNCIKKLFHPRNFIGRFNELDQFISDFNQYLAFDGWKIIRKEQDIIFTKADKINFDSEVENEESNFLQKEFTDINLHKLNIDSSIIEVLNLRFEEIQKGLTVKAPLSVIFLTGSSLEGILLGIAKKYPKEFNQSTTSPKDKEGKVKQFHEWTLSNFIDTAHNIGLLQEDVKKFSHSLREFRNYIHPYEQVSTKFHPTERTAIICWQVLQAAIDQLIKYQTK